jgi:predicted Zn-dependent protease
MEAGKIAESIALLEECQNLAPDSMTYPYEIAFAHYLGQDFSTAAKALKKLTSHKDVTDLVYQMLGNSYDLLGKPEKDFEDFAVWLSRREQRRTQQVLLAASTIIQRFPLITRCIISPTIAINQWRKPSVYCIFMRRLPCKNGFNI